jgi:hypothetical protein
VLTHKDKVEESVIKEMRSAFSQRLKFDPSFIMAVESYHPDENDDPLNGIPRKDEIEKRCLKLLTIALKVLEEQIKYLV